MGVLHGNYIIFYTLGLSAASYTRVKSEVQVLYRPPFLTSLDDHPPKRRPGSLSSNRLDLADTAVYASAG